MELSAKLSCNSTGVAPSNWKGDCSNVAFERAKAPARCKLRGFEQTFAPAACLLQHGACDFTLISMCAFLLADTLCTQKREFHVCIYCGSLLRGASEEPRLWENPAQTTERGREREREREMLRKAIMVVVMHRQMNSPVISHSQALNSPDRRRREGGYGWIMEAIGRFVCNYPSSYTHHGYTHIGQALPTCKPWATARQLVAKWTYWKLYANAPAETQILRFLSKRDIVSACLHVF